MRSCSSLVLFLLVAACVAAGQSAGAPPLEVYAGYSWLSNSFNGVPGAKHALNGWDTGVAFEPWHHLRFKLDYSMYRGTNLGDPQHGFFIQGGGQYEAMVHRERFYAQALVGEGGLNGTWFQTDTAGYKNGNTGSLASLTQTLGGGVDTPIGGRFAVRVEGDLQHSNFAPISPLPVGAPYHVAGVPNYFGRVSAGLVWMPRPAGAAEPQTRQTPESELVFEGISTVGHIHIFANSWWSHLETGGVEYDRHSWGSFLGARVDYSAEVLPLVVLHQPSKTDEWGNPLATTFKTVPGVGIFPLGMRLLWRDGDRVQPYYVIKSGMTGYTQKAFSQFASYENFGLNQSVGVEVRLSERAGFRAGAGVLHQSNGFVVPSNPGLDGLNWNAGISYRLGGAQSGD